MPIFFTHKNDMKFIVGQKKEMTRVYADGKLIPVTKVHCPTIHITQVKTQDKDGYTAIQVGYYPKKRLGKSFLGRIKNTPSYARYKEFRIDESDVSKFEVGKQITVSAFEQGDTVKVTGNSKGRGFTGVVKRHGFAGNKKTHGNKDQLRMPGSVGAQGPQHVFKGTRMGGRFGNEQITLSNLEIVAINEEEQTIAIKGAIPGHRNADIFVKADGEMDFEKMQVQKEEPVKEEKTEEVKEEVVTEKSEEEKLEAPKPEEKKEEKTEAQPEEKKEEVVSEQKEEQKGEESKDEKKNA